MKKLISFVFFFGMVCCIYAQDMIVKKDGTLIKAKVTKVGESEVEYKKFGSTSERLYTISTSNILSINYEDGEVEKFDKVNVTSSVKQEKDVADVCIASPAANNSELIAKYNLPIKSKILDPKKKTSCAFAIAGVTNNSVLSTDEIEIQLLESDYKMTECKFDGRNHHGGPFQISILNKTNNIVYVDLGACFRTEKNGESYTYYNTKIVTASSGTESGGAFNLGGITGALGVGGAIGSIAGATTLGGSSNSSVSTTEQMQRILAIPPHGSKLLGKLKVACAKKCKCEIISNDEPLMEQDKTIKELLKKILFKGGIIEYTPENSLVLNKYQITYSTDSQLKKTKNLFFDVYVKYIVGAGYGLYHASTENEKKEHEKLWNEYIEDDISKFIYGRFEMYQW